MNNAGVVHPFTKLVSIDGATMRRMLDINVMGVFYGLKHQIPVMERAFAETGRVGPVQRRFRRRLIGAPLLSAYAAAKHAVVGLTRSAAAETAARRAHQRPLPGLHAHQHGDRPAGRHAGHAGGSHRPDGLDDADAAPRGTGGDRRCDALICSPQNSFMTGQAVAVDGGLSAV